MPVTIYPSEQVASAWYAAKWPKQDPKELLIATGSKELDQIKDILQSSMDGADVYSSKNGLVYSLIDAYCSHHHIKLRPDDFWCAVLSQLSFHINANAETYRDHFVSHEGRKELEVVAVGTLKTVDMGVLAQRMTGLIEQNIKDPGFRTWMMPNFSTTTPNDLSVASILMMGSMQKYFDYGFRLMCGIPSVELLGSKEDWIVLEQKLDKLVFVKESAGNTAAVGELVKFEALLRPIFRKFVQSFEDPKSEDVKDFWNKVADQHSLGSGPTYLSGWITAFCFWNVEGQMIHRSEGHTDRRMGKSTYLELDGAGFHPIDTEYIPCGSASVPVKLDDNGTKYDTRMLAGSVAIEGQSSNTASGVIDTLAPILGWYMFEVFSKEEIDKKAEAERA